MAAAIISVVAQRLSAMMEEQIRNEVNLVRGVEEDVLELSSELKRIRNVLDDAENRGFKEKSVKDWLMRLEDTSYEMDDVLDEWDYAIRELQNRQSRVISFVPASYCLCIRKFVVRSDIAKKIKRVKAELDRILEEKNRYNFSRSASSPEPRRVQSTALIDLQEVYGRARVRDNLASKIVANCGSHKGFRILSVVGVGGLGKTTLAQLVYNDSRVEDCFDIRIWICVSDPFDEVAIAKGIIESAGGGSFHDTNQLNILLKHLIDSISGKKFFLVLDDVWAEDYDKWEPLKNSLRWGGEGSAILVTTRNERVAKMMGTSDNDILNLEQLTNEDCWLLLRRIALSGRTEQECTKLHRIGREIANKCKGLPLAAKTLGSLLRFKSTLGEWENVSQSEIWEMEEVEIDLFPHLLLSYNELSPTLKRCFSYCAVFPKDSVIDVEDMIKKWIALGYLGPSNGNAGDMELRGREYFNILAMRSLFQDFKKDWDEQIESCKMHDIVHDFIRSLSKNDESGRKKRTCQVCNPHLLSNVKLYRSLIWHRQSPVNLCDCLTTVRVLKLASCNLPSIPEGMENLIHLRWLDLSGSKLSREDTKTICKLYNLQFLWLTSCNVQEIPREIENLVQLRHLDLRGNLHLKELPESICSLHELRTLNVANCFSLHQLPRGISRLINLKHLHFENTHCVYQFPQGLDRLTSLRTLTESHERNRGSRMRWLKNSNHLSGYLKLWIKLTDDLDGMVEDAREAELRKEIRIRNLDIVFEDEMDDHEASVRMDVIEALEPHPDLQSLRILFYDGSKLPGWIASPLNHVRCIKLSTFKHLSALPPLGKLPCLEEVKVSGMSGLESVGREFLGISIDSSSSSSPAANIIGFPKLKKLTFNDCPKWKEWEDITQEEEESAAAAMPCLVELAVVNCAGLAALRRLLRKAMLLAALDVSQSTKLKQRYGDSAGYAWKSLSKNPCFQIDF